MTKKKIVWEHHQVIAVAKRSYIIRNRPSWAGTDVEAVRQAQKEVLPADRRRPIRSMQEVPRVIHLWKALREQGYTEEMDAVQPIQPPVSRSGTGEISTADLMSELLARLGEVLDEERLRRMVREEANRVLESRVPATILEPLEEDALSRAG
ncbi:hypothetical protein [Paraburkholderia oxyphila]|uniref:hypothetical protein n=1 Tax=Paraburkholderia oxyphila TaxID=614212 RepID=UPI0004871305|nr:hypothetical protein [Paraburkholderia oxyphila]